MRYFLCVVIALTLGASVHAQTIFGTNTGTFADWLGTYAMTDVPLREWGTVSDPSDPNSSVDGPNGSLITDGGTVTYAVNYPAGTYVLHATYAGNATYAPSTSGNVTVTID